MGNMRDLINLCEGAINYSHHYDPEAESTILDFCKEVKKMNGGAGPSIYFTQDGVKEIVLSARAEYAKQKNEAERVDDLPPTDDVKEDILIQKIHEWFKGYVFLDHEERTNDFSMRKPEVEMSDELSFLTDEKQLAHTVTLGLCDPTSNHFDTFVKALKRFTEDLAHKSYLHGLHYDLTDALGKRIPVILFYFKVVSGRDNITNWIK